MNRILCVLEVQLYLFTGPFVKFHLFLPMYIQEPTVKSYLLHKDQESVPQICYMYKTAFGLQLPFQASLHSQQFTLLKHCKYQVSTLTFLLTQWKLKEYTQVSLKVSQDSNVGMYKLFKVRQFKNFDLLQLKVVCHPRGYAALKKYNYKINKSINQSIKPSLFRE